MLSENSKCLGKWRVRGTNSGTEVVKADFSSFYYTVENADESVWFDDVTTNHELAVNRKEFKSIDWPIVELGETLIITVLKSGNYYIEDEDQP